MATLLPAPLARAGNGEALYEQLLQSLNTLGPFQIEEKKTSLHLVAGKAAFLGVHPRKEGLRLNLVLARPLSGGRLAKTEQVSKARFHNEVDVRTVEDFDDELTGWLKEAYELQH